MNQPLIAGLLAIVATLPAYGQGLAPSLNQPLGESEILRTIDQLGTGDPARKAPLSVTQLTTPKDAPKGEKPKKEGNGTTEITAQQAASFDTKTNQAVFIGSVVVKNPQFNIECDKLTAFLKTEAKEAPKAAGDAKPPTAAPAAKKPAADAGTGGIDRGIAEGSVVITQEKTDASGKVTRNVGRAERAVFDSNTGDITLTGNPQVEQGINTIVATDESTVIILNREGRMRVEGPHRSRIKDTADANAR